MRSSPTTEAEPGAAGAEAPPPSLRQSLFSVAAAFFGVQSRANRERDFTRGRPLTFILIGLGFTVAFVLSLILVVRAMLAAQGL